MEVLLPNCTASFFSLSLQPNPMMTTTTTTTAATTAAAAAAAATTTIFLILHSHIHCDLNHSCSKLTLHDLHLFLNPRRLHLPTPKFIFPSYSQLATILFFQISHHLLFSNLPPPFIPTAIFFFSNLPPSFKTYRHLFFKHYSFQTYRLLLSNPPPSFFFQTYRHLSNIPRHLLISILFSNLPPPPFFSNQPPSF